MINLASLFSIGKFLNNSFVTIAQKLQTRGKLVIPALVFALSMAFLANTIGIVNANKDKKILLSESV